MKGWCMQVIICLLLQKSKKPNVGHMEERRGHVSLCHTCLALPYVSRFAIRVSLCHTCLALPYVSRLFSLYCLCLLSWICLTIQYTNVLILWGNYYIYLKIQDNYHDIDILDIRFAAQNSPAVSKAHASFVSTNKYDVL
jgi:hypothetical protein